MRNTFVPVQCKLFKINYISVISSLPWINGVMGNLAKHLHCIFCLDVCLMLPHYLLKQENRLETTKLP